MNIMVKDLPDPWVCQMMPLRWRRTLAFQQTLHRQLHCPELLVTPHHLDGLALVVDRKQREGANQVEQIAGIQHPRHQTLLIVWASRPMLQIVHRPGIGVGPAVEMLLTVGGDGAEFGLLPTGRHHELAVVEENRASLAFGLPLLAVAQKLIDGLRDGLLHLGRLALDHHHRQAVQEQHDVRNDVVLGSKDANLELADGDEAVVVAVIEVDEAHRRAVLARLPVPADTGCSPAAD